MPNKKTSKKRSKSQSPLQRESISLKKPKSDTDSIPDDEVEPLGDLFDDSISEASSSESSQTGDMDQTVVKAVVEPVDRSIVTFTNTTTTTTAMSTAVLGPCETVASYMDVASQPSFQPIFSGIQTVAGNAAPIELSQSGSSLPVPPNSMQYLPNAMYAFPGITPGMAPGVVPGMMPGMVPTVPQYLGGTACSSDLSDNDVTRIALKLKALLTEEIETLVAVKVKAETATISAELGELRAFKDSATKEIKSLKDSMDDQEQYSRRICLRVSGIDENENEDTDKLVLDLARRMNVDLKIGDIDRSHRVGVMKESEDGQVPRSREKIVKFANYKARLNFIRGRKVLREANARIYVSEDLTKSRKTLFYNCRLLLKQDPKPIDAAYSLDGNIYIKDNDGKKIRVRSMTDLDPYMSEIDIPEQPRQQRQPRRRNNRSRR